MSAVEILEQPRGQGRHLNIGGRQEAMQEPLPENYRRLEAALKPPETYRDVWHERYHEAQRTQDTAAKRLARSAGLSFVRCPCGVTFSLSERPIC